MPSRRTTPAWSSAALLVLLCATSARAGGDALPRLRAGGTTRIGPDGQAAHSGVLTKAFCFDNPTRVCVPAGSTVYFTSSSPGPRADEGAPQGTTVSLQALDASAPFKAFGLTFAAHAPRPGGPQTDGDAPTMSLELRGFDVRGFLGQSLELGGRKVAAGPVELHLDDAWAPEAILRGVAPKDLVVGGWRVPAGTVMYLGGLPDSFTLTPRAGAKLTRAAADEYPPSATSVEHGPAWGVTLTTVEGGAPFEINGLTLAGRFSLARHGTTGAWEIAMGTLARAAKVGEVAMPAGAQVTLCGAALERASAPDGAHLTVAGHPIASLHAEHEKPASPAAAWVDDCARGKVTGYAIPLNGCPPGLNGAQLDAAFKPRDDASARALAQCKGP